MFVEFLSGFLGFFCFAILFYDPPCNPAEIGFINILFHVQYYQNLRVQDTFNISVVLSFPFFLYKDLKSQKIH